MNKKVLLISTIFAASLLVGGTFAAYAVTDKAGARQITIYPEQTPPAKQVTLEWGDNVCSDLEDIVPDHIYKPATVFLRASEEYTGQLEINIADDSTNKTNTSTYLKDYLRVYIYEGVNDDVEEGHLPTSGLVASSSLGQYELIYDSAHGDTEGIPYSIYIEFVDVSMSVFSVIQNDVVSLTIDWNAAADDEPEPGPGPTPVTGTNKVYLASNWGQAYMYTYGDNGQNRDFPGELMNPVGINEYDQIIYESEVDLENEAFIFSNGEGSQTVNIPINSSVQSDEMLFWTTDIEDSKYKVGSTAFDADRDLHRFNANLGKNPGPIFHAFSWTTNKVLGELDAIKNAGFKAIQLSPMQPVGTSDGSRAWYDVYQPRGFTIAGSGQNPIGTKDSLKTLTAAANEKGIDILVDVVCNHLANIDSQYLNADDRFIYTQHLYHDNGEVGNCENLLQTVRGSLSNMPDLMTENESVQTRVISMLKEYVDAGVRGFRFDAAKHIETPKDTGGYSSNFWPNVIGTINEYSVKTVGRAPYSYGEILGIAGSGWSRDWTGYTDYIDVTDLGLISNARNAVLGSDEGAAASNAGYWIDGPSYNALLFAESHDNFCHNETKYADADKINVLYGLLTSRNGPSTLYFPRINDGNDYGNYYGSIEPKVNVNNPSTDYKGSVISAINKLHNDFLGASEYLSAYAGCTINARTLPTGKMGIFVGHLDIASSASIKVLTANGYLNSGTYKDLITNNIYNFGNDEVTVTLTKGVAVLVQI